MKAAHEVFAAGRCGPASCKKHLDVWEVCRSPMLAAIRAAQAEARAEARAEALEQAARTVYRGVEGCHASASELDALVAAILALKASP